MELIAHRINTVAGLKRLPQQYGVELDLRDALDGSIYIQHNPFAPGENFEDYLSEYHHGTMILNVKSERIEHKILKLLPSYDVKSYFFLDSSFPMIYMLSKDGEKNIAIRISEYEGMDTAFNMAGKVNWIWVDCFTRIPIGKAECDKLHEMGYKLCFVSPELQGRKNEMEQYMEIIDRLDMTFDAVCTKQWNISKWETNLKRGV